MNESFTQSDFEKEEQSLREYGEFFLLDEQTIQQSKRKLMQQLQNVSTRKEKMQKLLAGLLALGVVFFSSIGTVSASYGSLPGDALFPLREYLEEREVEKAQTQEEKTLIRLSQLESKLNQIEAKGEAAPEVAEYINQKSQDVAASAGINDDEFINQLELFLKEENLMNKKTLLSAVIGLAMIVQPAMAQDTLDEVDPGVLPDSVFYVFDVLQEKIELLLTLNPEKDIEKRLEFALEKLAEARAMSEAGDEESADEALDEYEEYIDQANEEADDADEDEEEELSSRVVEATYKHVLILEDLLDRVPEQARKGIENAIEKSQNGNRKAIENVSKKDHRKAAAMAAKQVEKRLERLKELAEENGDLDADEVEAEAEDAEDEVELAESISDEADDEEAEETDELVKEAHRKHIEVLKEVYEKVPEQAQKGIERALENAERNEERFLEKVKDREERKAMKREMREYDDDKEMDDSDDQEEVEDDDRDEEEMEEDDGRDDDHEDDEEDDEDDDRDEDDDDDDDEYRRSDRR